MLTKDEKKLKEIFIKSQSYSGPSFQTVMKDVDWAYYPSLSSLRQMGKRKVVLVTFTAATVFLVTGASIFLTSVFAKRGNMAADSHAGEVNSSVSLPTSRSETINSADNNPSSPAGSYSGQGSSSTMTGSAVDSSAGSNSETGSAAAFSSEEEIVSSAASFPFGMIASGTYIYSSSDSGLFASLNSSSAEAVLEEGSKTGLILKYDTYSWTINFVNSQMEAFTYSPANWDQTLSAFKGSASYSEKNYSLKVYFTKAKQMTFIFNDGSETSQVIFNL
ncbi:MAG: hypothetical protein LKJ88_03960 [Bacilli bacterium]|jgi:hypothetical protein|nr:hypothetical protein [Bacilli bacterium]